MSAFFASSTASHGQIWDVDIYVRASREDGDKEQSETISNQITMLTDFVHGRPELRLHEIRKDDGISGVTFGPSGLSCSHGRCAIRRSKLCGSQGPLPVRTGLYRNR